MHCEIRQQNTATFVKASTEDEDRGCDPHSEIFAVLCAKLFVE